MKLSNFLSKGKKEEEKIIYKDLKRKGEEYYNQFEKKKLFSDFF